MHTCIHAYIYIYIYIYIYTYVCTYIHACLHYSHNTRLLHTACVYMCTCVDTSIFMCIPMHLRTYVRKYMRYIHAHLHMNVCTYVYTSTPVCNIRYLHYVLYVQTVWTCTASTQAHTVYMYDGAEDLYCAQLAFGDLTIDF